jgi:hypothetical protein
LVDPTYAKSAEYAQFWSDLRRGIFSSGEYKLFGKTGEPIWIQASYTPVFDKRGRVIRVIQGALNITQAKIRSAEDASLRQALSRSQAVIEFTLDGHILEARFCRQNRDRDSPSAKRLIQGFSLEKSSSDSRFNARRGVGDFSAVCHS